MSQAYGYGSAIHKYLTAEELDVLSPSFPLTATLKKFGKDASSVYSVDSPEWISALNDLWKEENLAKLKILTAWKVLSECSPYITQEPFNFIKNSVQQPTLSGAENGWSVISRNQVFSPLVAKLYAEKVLGSEVKENAMIGRPATADFTWREISPAIPNAFYDSMTNSINIMPAFINGLNWWDGITEMEIIGGLGTVIGHEISHGFDFCGSQFNGYGEPTPILADDDLEKFLNRVNQIVAYYDGLTVLPGIATPGNDLKMENTADLMGVKAAAILAASKENADMKIFFEMYAKLYVQVTEYYIAVMFMQLDTHAPNVLRVNVNAQMTPEFYEAFGVQEGDGMYLKPEDRLVVWGK